MVSVIAYGNNASESTDALTAPVTGTAVRAWTNPAGILAQDDGQRAVIQQLTTVDNEQSRWLRVTGFNFSIPGGAIITGVIIHALIFVSHQTFSAPWDGTQKVRAAGVKLIVANSVQGDDLSQSKYSQWGDAAGWPDGAQSTTIASPPAQDSQFAHFTWGPSLFGLALTPAVVNDSQFGCALAAGEPPAYSPVWTSDVTVAALYLEIVYSPPATVTADVAFLASVANPGLGVVFLASVFHETLADVEFKASVGFGVAVTSPAAGCPSITSATMTVAWTITAGSQAGYRVQVFSDAGGANLVYDSGQVGSSTTQHIIPAGLLPAPETLYVRISVTNDAGATGSSALTCFQTLFPTSVNVGGVAVAEIGECDFPNTLPGLRITWTPITPGAGETFVRYLIRRRVRGSGDAFINMAELLDQSDNAYTDHNVQSRETYEYAVVWQAASGASVLMSANQTTLPAGRTTFEFNWLHTANIQSDDSNFTSVRLDSWEPRKQLRQDVRYVQPWGRATPTTYVGHALYHEIDVPVHPSLLTDSTRWARIRELSRLQRDAAAVLCLRFGRGHELYFVTMNAAEREEGQKDYRQSLRFTETYFDEAVE